MAAHTITTDADGLIAGRVAVATKNGDLPAYFSRPAGGGPFPVVLLAAEIFGLNDHICDIARRLAKAGYAAIAPDFYFRYGDPSALSDMDEIRKIVGAVPDSDIMGDFDDALAYAASHGGDGGRAAVIGYCWGGRIAWLYAAHQPRLRACVPWYGRLDGEHRPQQPTWPLDIAASLRPRLLGLYGGADPSIPQDQVKLARELLDGRGEIVIYDGAPHAFFADYRDSYRETPAQDAWRRMLAFFKQQGM